jgi:hypothetical protein
MRKWFAGAVAVAAVLSLGTASAASAAVSTVYEQDFTTGTDGWHDSSDGWYGTISWNPATQTATVEGDADSAPFSRFDGYRDTWPGDWMAQIDVYLDPAWSTGTGFDYSVASDGTDGDHQRDFIFHAAVDAQGLWVDATNNSAFAPPSRPADAQPITTAGWYTLQHVFSDVDGVLAVTMNVLDPDGNTVYTTVRTNPADTIPDQVGGNRYAWFTYVNVPGGVEVDNQTLSLVYPDPGAKDDCKNGGFAAFGYDNQGQCVASTTAASGSGS